MKAVISRLTLVLVIAIVGLMFPLSSYAQGGLALSCPLGNAEVNQPYGPGGLGSGLVATGGTGSYTSYSIINGALPPGLSLNTSTGQIPNSYPTTAGTFSFTAQVVDSAQNTATAACSITVYPALVVTCPSSTAQVGVAYSSAVVGTGGMGPYSNYGLFNGSLPPGLTLNSSTGAVTGIPTSAGAFPFAAFVIDAFQHGHINYNCGITVTVPVSLSVTCQAVNTGDVGVPFDSGPMTVTGGTAPYMYSIVGTLPPGLHLNTSTGEVTGTPTASGTFAVKVADAVGNSNTSCMITINGPLSVTCQAVNTGDVGVPFDSGPMTVTGGTAPYTYSIVGTLPPGLTLNNFDRRGERDTHGLRDLHGEGDRRCRATPAPAA